MRSLKNSTFALVSSLALVSAACTAGVESDVDPDDDQDNPDDPDNQPVPLTPEGKFAITSSFDLATNAPGTAG